ncbi:MAG: FAD:protein FMN transferase [Pseudomonadota bacterium]
MIGRRRVIQIMAATAAAIPLRAHAGVERWRGRAMGADVSLDLFGANSQTVAAAKNLILALEARFSIYHPTSELSQLNAAGHGRMSDHMRRLVTLCHEMHDLTGGMFDPTVQPVFAALAAGKQPDWTVVGWNKVTRNADEIILGPNQRITFNGIAQGYVTDRVRDLLWDHGLRHALVNIGEHASIGGPFRLSLEDPIAGRVGYRTLVDSAVATSSPTQLLIGQHTHILHPTGGQAYWSSVSVEARDAARADALSTAMCLMPRNKIKTLARLTETQATMIDLQGDLSRFG